MVADNFHGAAAQDIRGANDQREPNVGRHLQGFSVTMGDAVLGLFELEGIYQILEPLAVLGQVDCIGCGAQDRDAGVFERVGKLERGLPTKLHNHAMQRAVLLLNPQDFHHMLVGQRLKIQSVRGIIICAYRFRIAVDHNGLIALICERVAGMAAAIVKFNALPNPVWTAAQNNHFFAIRWPGFAFG